MVEKIPFFAAAGLFSLIALVAQSSGGAMAAQFPLRVRVLNAFVVYLAYLAKAFYPQNLAFYYPHPGARLSWVLAGASAVLLLAITAVAILWRRRCPFLFVGWFWYLGTLVPTIGIVQIGIQQMADRYTYFPLIGIYLGLAWIGPLLVPAGVLRTRVLPVVAAASLVLLAATTFSQISDWHDSVTLLRHSMDCTRESSHAHELLADALIADGDVSGGVDELQRAIHMAAPYAPLHHSLGAAFELLGRTDDAVKEYEAALAIDASFSEARKRLESILTARRQRSEVKRSVNSSPGVNSARGR